MSENKIIVTAGKVGADMDVVACVIAYSELLKLEGKKSIPVIPGEFTASVTPNTLVWANNYQNNYESDGSEDFVIVDISDPDYCPDFVDKNKIIEVYDHRYGFQDYWKDIIQDRAHIEIVASCGTLIWEEFKKRGKSNNISKNSAKLLLASIISNSLNFKTPLTTDRDRNAYAELKEITGLNDDWVGGYFAEQEKMLEKDFKKYFIADTNIYKIGVEQFVIGQIELWDATNLLKEKKDEIHEVMEDYKSFPWIVNILNIEKGFNYIYSNSKEGRRLIEDKIGLTFKDNIAITDKLLLRKHLTKILRGI